MLWYSRSRRGFSRPRCSSIRMYGREKSAVVSPTNAVRATRNTLNGSMKNCSRQTSIVPCRMTRTTSRAAAIRVARLTTTLASGAPRRCPSSARTTAPRSGTPSTRSSSTSVLLERFEIVQVEALELLPDLEEEDSQDEDAHQHVQGDAQLDHHRHPIGGTGRGEEEPVLHREETNHLTHRIAPGDHHQEGEENDRQGDAQRVAGDGGGQGADGLGETEGEDDQPHPEEHGGGDVDQRLGVPLCL